MVGLYQPGDQDLFGLGESDLLAYQSVKFIRPTERDWIHVEFAPSVAKQFAFAGSNPGTLTTVGFSPLSLAVSAPNGTPQTYAYEAYCIFEAIGTLEGLQDVHIDPLGQAAVLEVMGNLDGSASDKWIRHVPAIIKETSDALSKISGMALPAMLA